MLIRLIKSEIKKIFKIKMNIILLLIAILGTGFFVGLKYYEYSLMEPVKNQQGEYVDSVSLLKYMDNTRHQYAGEWTLEKADKYQKDFELLIDKYQGEVKIDKARMIEYYGSHYQELIDLFHAKELTNQKFLDYIKEYNLEERISLDLNDMNLNDLFDLSIYYERNEIVAGLKLAYLNGWSGELSSEIIDNVNNLLIEKKSDSVLDELEISVNDEITKEQIKQMADYLKINIDSLPKTFDSTIPNDVLISGLDSCLWIPIICIIIILANIFGIEKQYDMEQIIFPTKASSFKITISKIITSMLVSFSVMLITIIVCILIGYIILPVHTWDMAMYSFEGSNLFKIAFTYKTLIIYAVVLSLMSALASSCIILALSYLTKNRFIVIVVMLLYIGVSIFLNITGYLRMMHPYNMTHIMEYFYNINAYTFIYNKVVPYRNIILLIWIGIITITSGLIIIKSKSRSARVV
ncbi:MAG: hypothetical protein RR585_02995, partial [Coprobacillus sp.]